jgi:ribonuclease R
MYEPSTYSTTNVGHYGLNLNAYAHTTIPIRNYASLVNQRLIKRFIIDGHQISDELCYQLHDNLTIITKHLNERNELNDGYTDEYIKIMTKKSKSN